MKKMHSRLILSLVIATTIQACLLVQTAFAADKTYQITFSTGQTAAVKAGEDFIFAITCQPPTDITEIKVSGGTFTAEKTTLGGPSTPQGVINGLWILSEIKGDVTITLILNTQEGADLPVIITGREEAEAAVSSSGGMGGGAPPGGGGAPPGGSGAPTGGAPGGTPPTGAPSGAPGGTPPTGAPTAPQQ